jgi:Polyketide cyclase / dehydrase and lipid transport
MQDADAIRVSSPRVTGVGTTFECDTRVGPLKLTDRMEVTEWRTRRAMTIRHTGLVRGVGRFTLKVRPGGTLFTWEERLRFPWWLGGPVTGAVASPVLRRIWKGNLATLKEMVESGA